MCARFSAHLSWPELIAYFESMVNVEKFVSTVNVVPTHKASVITSENPKEITNLTFGIKSENKDGYKSLLLNARSETAFVKPTFAKAIAETRCLVPASGYIEWKTEGAMKIPHLIRRADGAMFCMAGIYKSYEYLGRYYSGFVIMTTEPNNDLKHVHTRMPVVLPAKHILRYWLDPKESRPIYLRDLMVPVEEGIMVAHPISNKITDPDYQNADALLPPDSQQLSLF
jgi:putative SOS response-associated peptidase YedK